VLFRALCAKSREACLVAKEVPGKQNPHSLLSQGRRQAPSCSAFSIWSCVITNAMPCPFLAAVPSWCLVRKQCGCSAARGRQGALSGRTCSCRRGRARARRQPGGVRRGARRQVPALRRDLLLAGRRRPRRRPPRDGRRRARRALRPRHLHLRRVGARAHRVLPGAPPAPALCGRATSGGRASPGSGAVAGCVEGMQGSTCMPGMLSRACSVRERA
jgi:hypothetical protein